MFRFLFIAILQLSAYNLYAVIDSSTKKVFHINKLIIGAETNLKFITSDLDIQKQGFDLGLNLSYYTNNITYFGVFYNQMNDVWNTSDKTFLLDQNTLNISTANFNNLGVLAGYRMIENKKFILMPELRIGYGNLAFKSINSENIENVGMMTFDPRINFGYKITNSSMFGFAVSYLIPFYFDKKQHYVYNYSINNAGIGAFLKIPLGKNKNQQKMGIPTSNFSKELTQVSGSKPVRANYMNKDTFSSKENMAKGFQQKTNNSLENGVEESQVIDFKSMSICKKPNDSLFMRKITSKKLRDSYDSKGSMRSYTLVVASFKFQQNALKFLTKNNASSSTKYSVIYNEDVNRYRVVFRIFESKSKMMKIMKETRKRFPGTWILDF